ncbi:unnamed protein product, partial [Choristocarpus tenellus]
ETRVSEAKERLRTLTLQTLKYSTLWLLVLVSINVDRSSTIQDGGQGTSGTGLAFQRLEQWLVGFPCQVLIRWAIWAL